MTINKVKSSSYDTVSPKYIVEYIYQYSNEINDILTSGENIKTELSNNNKTQLKAIASELETIKKRLDYLVYGKY